MHAQTAATHLFCQQLSLLCTPLPLPKLTQCLRQLQRRSTRTNTHRAAAGHHIAKLLHVPAPCCCSGSSSAGCSASAHKLLLQSSCF
jgi:hypothetical protein